MWQSFIKLGFLQIIPLKLCVQICQSFHTNILKIVNFAALSSRGTETRCAVQKQYRLIIFKDSSFFHHFIIRYTQYVSRECVSTGARTRRSLGHHLLHPLILRFAVLCAPAVLRPRALQDAHADTKS